MKLFTKIRKKVPKGNWAIIEPSDSAVEKCVSRPLKVTYMNGDNPVGSDLIDVSLIDRLRMPVVFRQLHPCFKEADRFLFFGWMGLKRRFR